MKSRIKKQWEDDEPGGEMLKEDDTPLLWKEERMAVGHMVSTYQVSVDAKA